MFVFLTNAWQPGNEAILHDQMRSRVCKYVRNDSGLIEVELMNDQLHPEHGHGIAGSNSIFFPFFFFSGGGQSSLTRFQRSRQGANHLTVFLGFFFSPFHASSTRYHSCKIKLETATGIICHEPCILHKVAI